MPELPEVETIAANLRLGIHGSPALVGKCISAVHLLWERTLAQPQPEEFVSRICGQVIQDIGRRGKFLVMTLSEDTLLIHLRMSGDLLVESSTSQIAAHHRLVLDLDQDIRLAFNDPRKFGRVWLTNDPSSVLGKLGPEPLDESLTPDQFFDMLHVRSRQLKPLLMDQSFLAGLGNIYTDEALHKARLHPLLNSKVLTPEGAAGLLKSIRNVLSQGIRRSGASIDWVYRGGDFQNYFSVYQRTGKPCPVCGTPIERMVLGQRGTHFCPQCQPLPGLALLPD
jgi:formamidopyrimidine-DNA glycosylase